MNPRITIFRDKDGTWVAVNAFSYQPLGKCTLNEAYNKTVDSGLVEKNDKVYVKEDGSYRIYPQGLDKRLECGNIKVSLKEQ